MAAFEKKRNYSELNEKLDDLNNLKNSDAEKQDRIEQSMSIYLDLLHQDPAYASKNDIPDRLFTECFHPTILQERERKKRKTSHQNDKEAFHGFEKKIGDHINICRKLVKFYIGLIDPEPTGINKNFQNCKMNRDSLSETDKPAVVRILYQFVDYLGDLYRYKNESQEAILCYKHAILLSPSNVKPYNHLAVLETRAREKIDALYYYFISTKTTHANLDKTCICQNLKNFYTKNINWINKNNNAKTRASKEKDSAFQDKLVFAQFIELHQLLQSNTDMRESQCYMIKLDNVISGLEECLSTSAWENDSLFCKMVAINAFTVDERVTHVQGLIAQIFAYRFGTVLAERLERNLTKQLGAIKTKKIFGLAPLLICCEHILTFSSCEDEVFLRDKNCFWSKVRSIANEINKVYPPNKRASIVSEKSGFRNELPKEYDDFKGFTPFESFIPKSGEFVTYEDAIELISKIRMKVSDQDQMNNNHIKLVRFFGILENIPNDELILNDNCHTSSREEGSMYHGPIDLSKSDDEGDISRFGNSQHSSGSIHSMPDELSFPKVSPDKLRNVTQSPIASDNESQLVDAKHQSCSNIVSPETEKSLTNTIIRISPVSSPENTTYEKTLPYPHGLIVPLGLKSPYIPSPSARITRFSEEEKRKMDYLSDIPTKNPFVPNRSYKNYRKNKETEEQKYTQNSSYLTKEELCDSSLNGLTGYLGFFSSFEKEQDSKNIMEPEYSKSYKFFKEQSMTSSIPKNLHIHNPKKCIKTKNIFFNYPGH